ncbi:MAG: carboxypeptidase-like regulatory domain-containing protein [Janthinobacterium lividum]
MFLLLGGTSFFGSPCFAQTVFTVADQKTKKPLEFAQAALLHSNHGASTDSNGHFTLDNYILSDTIIISSLGYKSVKGPVKQFIQNPLILLAEDPIALTDVVVTAKKFHKKLSKERTGWFNDRVDRFVNLNSLGLRNGNRLVVWIENPAGVDGIVDELIIRFLLKTANTDKSSTLFRVCALAGQRATGPEQNISIVPTISSISPHSQTTHVLLKDKQLFLPANGGFISIELLSRRA